MFENRPEQISGFRVVKGNNDLSDEGESDLELDDLPQDGINEKRALYEILVTRLREFDAALLAGAQKKVEEIERQREQQALSSKIFTIRTKGESSDARRASLWQSLKQDDNTGADVGFSFGIDAEEEDIV